MSTKPRRVAADMWLRLAARSPFHDNSSLRVISAMISGGHGRQRNVDA
jgi:hypothetical protein